MAQLADEIHALNVVDEQRERQERANGTITENFGGQQE